MMYAFKRFVNKRKLMLCVEKNKNYWYLIGGRKRARKYGNGERNGLKRYRNIRIEILDHIKELCRKGRMAARKIWSLGERICKDDFTRRWMLFRYLSAKCNVI